MGTIAEKWLEEGKEQGRQDGLLFGVRDSIIDILRMRFGHVPEWIGQSVDRIDDLDRLKSLRRRSITVESLASWKEAFEETQQCNQ